MLVRVIVQKEPITKLSKRVCLSTKIAFNEALLSFAQTPKVKLSPQSRVLVGFILGEAMLEKVLNFTFLDLSLLFADRVSHRQIILQKSSFQAFSILQLLDAWGFHRFFR
jgi:hypothetical protein